MKDNRTTIKVNKETKAEFDKLHSRLELKNHDVTLSKLIGLANDIVVCPWKYYSSRPVITREDMKGYDK